MKPVIDETDAAGKAEYGARRLGRQLRADEARLAQLESEITAHKVSGGLPSDAITDAVSAIGQEGATNPSAAEGARLTHATRRASAAASHRSGC